MPITGVIESAGRYAIKTAQRAANALHIRRATVPNADRFTLSTDIKEAKNVKDFVNRFITSWTKQNGFKIQPSVAFMDDMITGNAAFKEHGVILLERKLKIEDIPRLGESLAHELDHFRAFSEVVRLPHGLKRLEQLIIKGEDNARELFTQLEERCVIDDVQTFGSKIPFIGKIFTKETAQQAKAKMISCLRQMCSSDLESLRTFWPEIIKEKGYLTPGTPEYKKAEKYLEAIENYESGIKHLKSLKAYLTNAIRLNPKWRHNLLEKEAIKAGKAFQKENSQALLDLRDRLLANNKTG